MTTPSALGREPLPASDHGPAPAAAPQFDCPEILHGLYRGVLGRDADPGAIATFVPHIAYGAGGIATVTRLLLESEEYGAVRARQAEASQDWVELAYLGSRLVVPQTSELVQELSSGAPYEPYVLPYFLALVQPGMAVLDVGASLGTFTIPAAAKVGPAGHVYAVEVSPRNSQALLRSVAANGLSNVTLLPFGASDRLGADFISANIRHHNFTLHAGSNPSPAELGGFDIVPSLPLDLVREKLGRIQIIKLDIEGLEYRALLGAKDILAESRPILFTEYSPGLLQRTSHDAPTRYVNLIYDMGYDIEILHRAMDREPLGALSFDQTVARIGEAFDTHQSRDGGTHLDLCCLPRPQV